MPRRWSSREDDWMYREEALCECDFGSANPCDFCREQQEKLAKAAAREAAAREAAAREEAAFEARRTDKWQHDVETIRSLANANGTATTREAQIHTIHALFHFLYTKGATFLAAHPKIRAVIKPKMDEFSNVPELVPIIKSLQETLECLPSFPGYVA